MKIKNLFLFSALIFLFGFCFPVLAAPPDSGSILRQQEQVDLQRMPPASSSAEIEASTEMTADPGIKVRVKSFEFTGYEKVVSLKELERIAGPYVGNEVSFGDLQRLAQKITIYLRETKGYLLARAYLPQQDVTEGNVIIAVSVGRLDGKVGVSIDGDHRINKTFLERIAHQSIAEGETVMLKDVERAVLLMNDLPGISAKAYLDKGEVPGTSRLSLLSKEGRWAAATVSGDNFGNRYTGRFRRTGQVALIDSLGKGDLLRMTYINADDLNQGRADLSLPVGSRGAIADFSYNGLRYELGGKLKDLQAKGSAHTFGTNLKYPVKRTRRSSIWIGSGYDHYLLEDKAAGDVTSDRSVSVANLNVTGNFYDEFYRGGLTSFLVALYAGRADITDGISSDDLGARVKGDFSRVTYALARLQRATKNTSLFFSARGQVADGNLDSSQKIILGGPTGVRAYPIGEASGDTGHILTFENRYDLPLRTAFKTQLVGFVDAGQIRLHEDTWTGSVTNISGRNHYWLSGTGVGINIEKPQSYRVQFSYAHTLGKNPGRDAYDNNSDNQDESGRVWAQATIWF